MLLHTFSGGGVGLLKPLEDVYPSQRSREHVEKTRLSHLDEVLESSSAHTPKSIDEKISKTRQPLKKHMLSSEEATLYFTEAPKVHYDFSYLGNLAKEPAEVYTEASAKPTDVKMSAVSSEKITNTVLNQIIAVQKMDTIMGTRTGVIDQGTQEHFDLLRRLSFYEAIIRVNYDLHT